MNPLFHRLNKQRRLSNLDEQSRRVEADLSARAEAYLSCGDCPLPEETRRGDGNQIRHRSRLFPLPNNGDTPLDVVYEKALHQWFVASAAGGAGQSNGDEASADSGAAAVLPYERLSRIRSQIADHPERRRWAVNVGGGWDVVRAGDVLEVRRTRSMGGSGGVGGETEGRLGVSLEGTDVLWKIVSHVSRIESSDTMEGMVRLNLNLPSSSLSDLSLVAAGDYMGAKFVPPWRRGRSPIKLKDFLRGQGVPLHRREHAVVLCLARVAGPSDNGEEETAVVAVYIEEYEMPGKDRGNTQEEASGKEKQPGRWFVHGEFNVREAEGEPEETLSLMLRPV